MRMPTLETKRLVIRPFSLDDLAACHQILDLDLRFERRSLEERQRWLEWTVMNYEELAALRQPPYGDRAIVLKHTNQLIGSCGFVPCLAPFELLPSFETSRKSGPDGAYSAEVGLFYALSSAFWGKGYATEAARALINFAFRELHLRRIVAMTEHNNTHSVRVMQNVGMQIERNLHPVPGWFQVVGVLEYSPTSDAVA